MNPALLKGKKVVGTEGYILGEMGDLHVDTNLWKATAFYVNLSSEAIAELNFKKQFLRKIVICLPTSLIKAVGDIVSLNSPVSNLKDVAEKEICPTSPKVEGKKVVSTKGFVVGDVEGFDVVLDNWAVTGLQVALTDDAATQLEFKRPFISKVVVVIPPEAIGSIGNFVTLDKNFEDLKMLVECIKSCQLKK